MLPEESYTVLDQVGARIKDTFERKMFRAVRFIKGGLRKKSEFSVEGSC